MKSKDRCEPAKRPHRRLPIRCTKCFSYNAELLWKDGPKACCLDCDTVYPVKFRHVEARQEKRTYDAIAGEDQQASVPQQQAELGPVSECLASPDARDPQALIRAHHKAAKLARQFDEEFERKWFLENAVVEV